jgi:hypothetical protein
LSSKRKHFFSRIEVGPAAVFKILAGASQDAQTEVERVGLLLCAGAFSGSGLAINSDDESI